MDGKCDYFEGEFTATEGLECHSKNVHWTDYLIAFKIIQLSSSAEETS